MNLMRGESLHLQTKSFQRAADPDAYKLYRAALEILRFARDYIKNLVPSYAFATGTSVRIF